MHWLRRYILEIVTTAYVLLTVWVGLVPFDLSFSSAPPLGQTWIGLPIEQAHWADVASNIALFLPAGLLIRATLWKRGWWHSVSLVVSLAACAVVSYGIEFAQLFSAIRISSVADFGSNLVGGMAGVASISFARSVGGIFGDGLWFLGRRWRDTFIERPSALLAQLCAVSLFLFATSPFDVTFAPNLVYKSVSETHLIPFTQDASLSATITNTYGGIDGRSESRRLNDRWQRVLDYPTTVAGYALLAVLVCHYLKNYCNVIGRRRAVWTLQSCALLAVFSSCAQLFVLSRSFDTTDILLAIVGAGVGVCVADRVAQMWAGLGDRGVSKPAGRVTLLRMACLAVLVVVIARELTPFRFDFGIQQIGRQIQQAEFVPFKMYQTAKLPLAVEDMLAKFGRLALLAGLFAAWRSAGVFKKNMGRVGQSVVGFGLLVAILEFCQLLLPARTPSVTDVLLAVAGVAIGIVALRVAVAACETIRSQAASTWSEPMFNVTFDENEAAPKEQAARPAVPHEAK